jgi:hypothetical protein
MRPAEPTSNGHVRPDGTAPRRVAYVLNVFPKVSETLARHVSISTLIPGREWTTAALLDLAEKHLDALAAPRPCCALAGAAS